MNIEKYYSPLDTDRFQFKVAKIDSFDLDLSTLHSELIKNGYKLILSKVDANEIDLINELEKNGYLLKDIQLTFKYDLKESLSHTLSEDVIIREATLNDKDQLHEIAIKSFSGYGHYAADKKLDIIKCNEIYGDWIARSFDKQVADTIIVADINGEIAGFLSHKIYNQNYKYAAGGIGAVDPKFRSKDIFRAITISGINWAIKQNCQWVEHNVLVTNLPVNRSLTKLGFKLSKSTITFHKWL